MIVPDLLAILCCPETRQPLALAEPEILAQVNARVAAHTLTNRAGEAVLVPLSAGLVRLDRTLLYPVREDLPILLVDEGIFL